MNIAKKVLVAGAAVASLSVVTSTQAHTVALGWEVLAGGDVQFYNLHWHGNVGSTSNTGLFIDSVEHKFTGIHNDVGSYSNLDGAIFNESYATFDEGTLTAISSSDDWFSVTVSGLEPGQHTFGTTSIALTQWNIPNAGSEIEVTLPDAPPSSGPTGVPDASNTFMMLGLAMMGLVAGARKRLKK